MVTRKCAGCGKLKDTTELLKITRQSANNEVIVNNDNKIFGRSAYICYNKSCVENAFKKNRISKILKASVPETLKGKLINEF